MREVASGLFRSGTSLDRSLGEDNGVGDGALASGVEAAVVRGVVDDAFVAAVFDVHGGGATAVQVDRVAASQPPHDPCQFGQAQALGFARVAAVDYEQHHCPVRLESDGGAVVAAIDEVAVHPLRDVHPFAYQHGPGGHDVAVGQGPLGHAAAVRHQEAGTACGGESDGGILVVFAVDAVISRRGIDPDLASVNAEITYGYTRPHVEVRAVDGGQGSVAGGKSGYCGQVCVCHKTEP